MSGLRSRSSLSPTKVFLLSGLPGEERHDLAKKIKQLGGKYFPDEDFKAHCTHVVCGKLTRSEKFLGACATGKWVLHPDYIRESTVAKDWLDEEQFEWCDDHIASKMIQALPLELAYASRRWRFMLGDQNRAFTGWKVAVVVGANRSKALRRLLISGGAEVIPMKLPVKNPEKVANSIGYIFVSEQRVPAVAHLLEYGVLCIKPEFIGDYLIKDPPADPMDYLVQVGAGEVPGVPASQGDSEASFMMASQISLPLSDPSSELDGKVHPSSSQSSNKPSNETTGMAAETNPVTAKPNIHVVGEEDHLVNSVIKSKFQASNTVSKTKIDKTDISVTPLVIDDLHQNLVRPGPSGAASQTGSQRSKTDALKSGLHNSQSQNQSSNAPGQRAQVPSVPNQSNNAPGQRTQVPSVSNQSNNAPGQRTQVPSVSSLSNNAPGQRTQVPSVSNQSNNAPGQRTQVPSVSDLAVAGVNSEKTPTPSSNLKKALDESKVKRTRERTIVSVKKETKKSNNSPNVNVSELENDMNVKNCMKNLSDTTGETPQIRTSGRLKHRKSEPVWKDLVPKKRASTEKIENNVLKKRPSMEKEENQIPKREENNETNEGTGKVLKEATVKVADNELVDCEIIKVENVVKTQMSTEKEGRQKHGSLTLEEWLKNGAEKVLKETMVKTISNNITDCAIRMNNVSAAANKGLISGNTLSTVKSETSKICKSETKADSVSDTKNITKAHRATSKNCKSEHKAESVSETKNIIKAHSTTIKVEEHNTSIVADDVKLVEKDVKGVTCGPEKDVKGVTCGPNKDVKGVTCGPEKDVKGVTCGPQMNWSEKTTLDNVQPSSSVSAIKKKRSRQDADLQSILKEVKRQKVSHCAWRPTVLALDPSPEVGGDAMIMPMTLTEIIHSSLEEKLSQQTAILDDLSSKITAKYMPQSKTLHAIMVNLLLGARSDLEANKAYQVLMKILHLHPPTSPGVQEVYRKSLCTVDSSGLDEGETAQGADWILLKGCICNIITDCLSSDSSSSQTVRNSELLVKYLICLIEQDLQHIVRHHHHIQEIWSRPLVLRILWSPSYHVVLNSKCRELLDLMSEVLICLRTNVPTEQKEKLLKILKTIVWLVAMATECSRLSEGGSPEGLAALQCEKTLAFVHELAQRITTADMTDATILQVIFSSLQLPWQCVGLSQQLLNNMDDYLLADEQVRDLSKITLSHIVSRYFFLLPKFNMRAGYVSRCPDSPAKKQRNLISSKKTACLRDSNANSTENIAKLNIKINKKNSKGETPLHTACIKNDVNKLKQLLKTPGVDVNMKDNAGWTPLHEACNHGNIQCVQELLKFVPAKTMEHYFKKDCIVLRKVDLLAKTEEGITPLHDAVLNNRTEVCRMLLQHGGHKLLSAETCLNYTPLQLAETEEMHSMLSSYLPPVRRVSDSQEFSFSQDSMMSVDETRSDLPPDHLYEEVTMNGDTRIFADKHAMFTYIYLVTCLLKNYIKAIDAEMIREKIKEKINLAKSRQRLYMDSCSQNRDSSQEVEGHSQSCQLGFLPEGHSQSCQLGFLPSSQTDHPLSSQESEPFTPTNNIPFSLSQGDESSDKENKRFPFTEKNHSVSLTGVSLKKSSEIKPDLVENRINKTYVRGIKKDLKVLKGLQKHIEMFETHLERISAKDDTELIELELLEIHVLLDNILS